MSKKVYVIVDSDYRFIDVKATRSEAEVLIKGLQEGLKFIEVTGVTYNIKEKEI